MTTPNECDRIIHSLIKHIREDRKTIDSLVEALRVLSKHAPELTFGQQEAHAAINQAEKEYEH